MTDLPTTLAALRQRLEAFDQQEPWVRDVRARLDRFGIVYSITEVPPGSWLARELAKLDAEIAEREER